MVEQAGRFGINSLTNSRAFVLDLKDTVVGMKLNPQCGTCEVSSFRNWVVFEESLFMNGSVHMNSEDIQEGITFSIRT